LVGIFFELFEIIFGFPIPFKVKVFYFMGGVGKKVQK
jgi:hypothetical protein